MPRERSSDTQLHCLHVTAGQLIPVPAGFTISHTVLIEPKRGKPYFTVLLTNEKTPNTTQLPSVIGFRQE